MAVQERQEHFGGVFIAAEERFVVATRSVAFYRPGRHAARIRCPLLVLAYDDDGVTPPRAAIRAARPFSFRWQARAAPSPHSPHQEVTARSALRPG